MKRPPYPKYRSGGIEWLGDVPEHWDALPLKRRHRVVNGGTPASGEETYWDGEINWITPEDLGRNETKLIGGSRRKLSRQGLANCGAQLVPADSVVLSTRAPIGHVAVTDTTSCTNQGCRSLVGSAMHTLAGYVYYTIIASRSVLQASGKGTTFMELGAGALGLHVLPFPPATEQRAIAEFLDQETARIDTLIEKKRTLIERLKEKRTALISRTVTRGLPPEAARAAGLDPHPKLKPSGIDWLGDVPEHWEVKRLKWAVMFQRGHDLPADEREEGNVPLVSSAGVSATHSRSAARGPGIVTGRYGTIGEFHVIEEDYWPLNTTLYSIDLHRNDPHFLQALLTHLSPLFLLNAVKSAVPGVDRNDIHQVRATVPPDAEQEAIADFLCYETTQIKHMIERVEIAIERVLEYRTALITAAVTGKIDVRGVAAEAPQ